MNTDRPVLTLSMIEAGVSELTSWDECHESPTEIVRKIYCAMKEREDISFGKKLKISDEKRKSRGIA